MSQANALKDAGNKAFAAKDYNKAIELFTQAIAIDPSNHVLYSNRSAAYSGKHQYTEALEDAEACIKANSSWSKGYARKGAALHGLKRWEDAIAAYNEGLKLEDSPALRKGLKEVQDAAERDKNENEADPGGFSKMFADPNLLGKLATNPKTQKHLADPAFVAQLQAIQKNPQLASTSITDPRMIDVLGVLLGIDMQGFTRPEGSDELPPGVARAEAQQRASSSTPQSASTSTPPPPKASSSTHPAPAPTVSEDVEMKDTAEEEEDPDVLAGKQAEKDALEQKKIGGEAYKKRDFATAATAFEKAWDLWPKDVTFLTNLGAVYFEQGEYDKCIATCEKAVDEGRSLRADYKLIAKALGRIGSAYSKKGDLTEAIRYFQKSLTEHRTPDILTKLREAEKQKADADAKAYISSELSEKAREEGNALFKSGDFAGAVKSYTESIKRDPSDPRGYNNRALCYTKLAALPEALKDADKAIEIDPKFVKGYIRKSNVLFSMREYTKAIEAIQEAAEHDEESKHSSEIQQQMMKCNQALMSQRAGETEQETLERAMRDPEVAEIMSDPIMQQILQQGQQNPGALQDHMKNPTIRNKIMKLINAGIIKTR